MDSILQLMSAHRTVRSFLPGRLDDKVVDQCVSAAQMAATSSNVQPYALIRVEDVEKREALAELCGGQSQVEKSGAFFILCADQKRFRLIAESSSGAYSPNLESFMVGAIDGSLFAQNLVLAFESKGLGTCFIGGLRNDLTAVSKLLQLPRDVFPLFGLCVGEIANDPGPKPRLASSAVLYTDRYPSDSTILEDISEYDERMATYYEERELAGRNWSGGILRKWAAPTREYLADYYRSQGANLR
ncbi:MAG: FMN reductase (NADPH) [Planctomycetota bacterium]|jgi:FMN reductase (NADPH)